VVSAVGIVSIPLDFLRRDWNVFAVFPAFCVDVAIDDLDFRRIAVRIIATAGGRMIRHVPGRIEFLVQRHILRWMVPRRVIFCALRRGWDDQYAAKKTAQENFAQGAQCATSLLWNREPRGIAVEPPPRPALGGLNPRQKSAVILSTGLEAVGASFGAEGGSPGVVSDQAKLSLADRATPGCAVTTELKIVAHSCLL
jgi:hypothetical protein